MAEDIRREGGLLKPEIIRRAVLGGLEVKKRNKYGTADNVVVMGCFCFGVLLTVRSFCLLLNRLGVDYVFLQKEYCCGAPLLGSMYLRGEDVKRGEELAKEVLGHNISQAKQQGAKNVIYFCIWCAVLAKRFFPRGDINQMFFADVLVDRLKDVKLSLKGRIGYYRGCFRQTSMYFPRDSSDTSLALDWSAYRDLLNKVEGLEIIDIPSHYCCKVAQQCIFRSKSAGVPTQIGHPNGAK